MPPATVIGPQVLQLNKGSQVFQIRYEPGDEEAVLDQLAAMVSDHELEFDWFDAAVMSHGLSKRLAKKFKSQLPPQKP